jgi:hypothetical protein
MSRLEDNKPVAPFSPQAEDVQERIRTGPPARSGEPIKSASSYAQRVQERRSATNSLKDKGAPLGGAPPIAKGKLAPLSMPKPSFNIDDEEPPPITRDEALHGVGAAYPVNQALSRGDVRSPVSLGEAKRTGGMDTKRAISEETMDGLKAVKDASDNRPPESEKDEQELALEKAEKDIAEDSAPIDFAALIGARNELLSERRRKDIEARLEKLDIADMITNREIKQRVPIIAHKFEITLRTFSQTENLYCLRHLSDFPGSQMYQEEMLNTFKLVCAVVAINDALLPEHRKDVGLKTESVDPAKFNDKLQAIIAFPVQVVGDLSVQNIWFQRRVEKLFSWENLKNG